MPENTCYICGKKHERRNIDLLPTWLQCRNCGKLYCVQCSKSSILNLSIEKLLMIVIVVVSMSFGVILLESLREPFTQTTLWGVLMTIIPVLFQLLIIKYHDKKTFRFGQVLKKCSNCDNPLSTLYYDSILNNWLFTIYALNILIFLFMFFFKLYHFEINFILRFNSMLTASLFIIFIIGIFIGSLILSIKFFKNILKGFQSSYRIWIVVIFFYIICLYSSGFIIYLLYMFPFTNYIFVDIVKIFNIIFTATFSAIPQLFWFVPPFLLSAFIYMFSINKLMDHKLNLWIKLLIGFIIIALPIIIWGIFNPFFIYYWENLISWSIASFIFNFILGLSIINIFNIYIKSENESKIKNKIFVALILLSLICFLIIYSINLLKFNFYNSYFTNFLLLITFLASIFLIYYELKTAWFNINAEWRSKIFKKFPDATYLIIVGIICYCIALNSLNLLSLSPFHPYNYIDIPSNYESSTNYFEILYPNLQAINLIGLIGLLFSIILGIFLKIYNIKSNNTN